MGQVISEWPAVCLGLDGKIVGRGGVGTGATEVEDDDSEPESQEEPDAELTIDELFQDLH